MKKEVRNKEKYFNCCGKIKEQGITLVALVVTIIILLILAGVTLNIALSDNGLFEKSRDAVEKYEKAEEDEEEALNKLTEQLKNINIDYSKYVGAIVTGYNPETKTCTIKATTSGVDSNTDINGNKIADNIDNNGDQTFKTEDKMKWRIWDYDGKTLTIIGDPTTNTLTLNGVAGYNNGVWAINEICKQCYSNTKIGAVATSLKRSDIQEVSSYDYTKYKHVDSGENAWKEVIGESSSENLIYFGETKTINNGNTKYPQMWGDNDQKWKYEYERKNNKKTGSDQEGKKWEEIGTNDGTMGNTILEGNSTTTFKQSYYAHDYIEGEFPNKKYYNLIFKKSDEMNSASAYWLAGRYALLFDNRCDFGMQIADADYNRVSGNALFISDGSTMSFDRPVRPMVSINLKSSKCKMEVTLRRRWICNKV